LTIRRSAGQGRSSRSTPVSRPSNSIGGHRSRSKPAKAGQSRSKPVKAGQSRSKPQSRSAKPVKAGQSRSKPVKAGQSRSKPHSGSAKPVKVGQSWSKPVKAGQSRSIRSEPVKAAGQSHQAVSTSKPIKASESRLKPVIVCGQSRSFQLAPNNGQRTKTAHSGVSEQVALPLQLSTNHVI